MAAMTQVVNRRALPAMPCARAWLLAAIVVVLAASVMTGASTAYAEELATADGFTLGYSVEAGKATITGVVNSPQESGNLKVPDVIEGAPVVAIGKSAFESVDKIEKVELPASLQTLGDGAFKSSSLTSIQLPAALQYVPYQCFWGCSNLENVTFAEGATPEYIGTRAFMGCTALTEIVLPPLVGNDHDWICESPTSTFSGKGNYRIGVQCFMKCTHLEKLVFLPGNPEGLEEYLKSGGSQFGDNSSNFTVLCYCRGGLARYADTAHWYFAVNVYQSQEDAEADKTHTNPWKVVLYPAGTNLLEILKQTTAAVAYAGSDEWPGLPMQAQDAGYIWGVGGYALTSARATLAKSLDVYPVDRNDLAFAWVTSPEIETAAKYNGLNVATADDRAFVRLARNGKADLSGMAVYAPDGTKLDADDYTLSYERGTRSPIENSNRFQTIWSKLDSPDDVNAAGQYRVCAHGTGQFAETHTNETSPEFNVRAYTANVYDCVNASVSEAIGLAEFQTASALSSTPKFMVVAPESSWRYGLVASGLAGVGDGQAILVNGESTSSSAYLAIQASGAKNVIFLGTEAEITKGVVDKVKQNVGKASYDMLSGSGYEDLAVRAFNTIREFGPSQATPYDWGTTAIVVSGTRSFDTAPIAQYAYQAKAPVFFTGASGALSSATLAALSEGGFSKVVVAGDASYVSDAACAAIRSATGISPDRVLNDGASAFEKSKAFMATLHGAFADEQGVPVNSGSSAVVASALDAASVVAGAQLAAAVDGTLIAVSSSADVKLAERYLAEEYGDLTNAVYVVGDFSGIDAAVVARFKSIWSTPMPYAVGSGDTVEAGGVLYQLGSGAKGTLKGVADKGLANVQASSFAFDGQNLAVDSIAAGALAGNTAVKTFSSSASTVGANAFEGCTSLASVTLPSVTGIGASAFSGCSKLASAPIAKVKSVSASAFANCTSLKTVSASAATSVAASAFGGCTALTKATLPKATSLGANAFSGCKKLKSVSIPKVKTIGSSAFANCAKLASVTGVSVASVGATAFSDCTSLKTAAFTSTALSKINAKAFFNCKKLKTLKLKTKKLTAAKVGANAFKGMPAAAKVSVPKAKVAAYKNIFVKKGLSKKSKVVAG